MQYVRSLCNENFIKTYGTISSVFIACLRSPVALARFCFAYQLCWRYFRLPDILVLGNVEANGGILARS